MYCENCLLGLFNEQPWRCPECRKPHDCAVKSLTRNYHLEKLVEKFKKEKPISQPKNLFGTCMKHDRDIEYREYIIN